METLAHNQVISVSLRLPNWPGNTTTRSVLVLGILTFQWRKAMGAAHRINKTGIAFYLYSS